MPITIVKKYVDIPFAHRQPNHPGHCRYIHGHNWSFEIEFGADVLDRCGFVVDFGGLKPLKEKLNELFDHSLVLNMDDPILVCPEFIRLNELFASKVVPIPDCSCEGLARFVFAVADDQVKTITAGRAYVVRVTVFEDSKNQATYTP